MNLMNILSMAVLIAMLVTAILATGSFLVYRLREAKRPVTVMAPVEKIFFRKYDHAADKEPAGKIDA